MHPPINIKSWVWVMEFISNNVRLCLPRAYNIFTMIRSPGHSQIIPSCLKYRSSNSTCTWSVNTKHLPLSPFCAVHMLHKPPQCTHQIQEPDINVSKSIKKKNKHVVVSTISFSWVITLDNKNMLYYEHVNSGIEKKIRQKITFQDAYYFSKYYYNHLSTVCKKQ